MIKAILFDMNGIIIDDEHIHEQAFCETVNKFDIDLSHEEYLKCCAGKTDKQGYIDIENEFHVDLPIEKLLKEKAQVYLKLFPENKVSYKGVINLIKKLAKEYTIALTSSSSRAEVDLVIKEFGISDNFAVTISGDDVNKGKPNPEPYIKTAQIISVKSKECVVIEDSVSGIRSAKDAGCYCIAITTTHTRSELQDADIIVDKFEEVDKNLINNIEK